MREEHNLFLPRLDKSRITKYLSSKREIIFQGKELMYLTFTKVYEMVPFETLSKPGGDRFESLRNSAVQLGWGWRARVS